MREKHKWKEKNKEHLCKYRSLIAKYKNNIWCPNTNVRYKNIKTNSCYDIKKYTSKKNNKCKFKKIHIDNKIKEVIKSKKYEMILTKKQKRILSGWLCATGIMYNKTLKYIKDIYKKTGKTPLKFSALRTQLKKTRNKIIEGSNKKKKNRIRVHIMDESIKLVTSNYKSALTNYKRGNIRHFRIRYWRKNKKNRICTIEKEFFKGGNLCKGVLGEIKYKYNKKYVKLNINSSCKLHYNIKTRKYALYVPIKVPVNKTDKTNIISLDPGIRTFMCGLTKTSVIKIGNTCSGKIKKKLKRLDKIKNNKNISNKIKRKNENMINRKITNIVDEMQWKSIKYLTDNYGTILIGDMSVKGIVNNKTSNINKMVKRLAYKMKFYTYRQRLEYKCESKAVGLKVIDEKYTSKVCSNCGWYNKKLGGNKIYKCPSCKKKIDRDVNGCRGIFIKQWF